MKDAMNQSDFESDELTDPLTSESSHVRSQAALPTHVPAKSTTRTILMVVLPLVAVVLGVVVLRGLVATKPEPERAERVDRGTLVRVEHARVTRQSVALRAQGTVTPAQQASLVPQVTGRVRWMSDAMTPGGRFESGQKLVRLERRDYTLAIQSRNAEAARAQLSLELEQSRQQVAQREWQTFGNGETAGDLALRQPQVRSAQVGVSAAQSGLRRARLDLRRTELRAPFNGMIVNENVEVGQFIPIGQPVATLIGTDAFWVQASIPVSALRTLVIDDENGSRARIIQEVDGQRIERDGRVIRMLPDLDPVGSMARVLVTVQDPLGLSEGATGLPLLLGSFVKVEIEAGELDSVIEVPRSAVHEGNKVYVAVDGKLEIREVDTAWGRQDSVLVRSGISEGDAIVVSRMPSAITGMRLRIQGEAPAATREAEPTSDEAAP